MVCTLENSFLSLNTIPQSWLRQSSSLYYIRSLSREPFSAVYVRHEGFPKGRKPLGRIHPEGALIASGNRPALTEARAERREPLGVGERNGVGIAKKNSIAYEKGRNTNVSAL